MRAPILALLLLALASSRQAFAAETTDAIAGVQANCKSGADIPATGASNEDCKQCVADIGNLAGLASQRMYACYDVCQSPALFPGSTTSSQCISCIENTTYTVQACKDCMSPAIASDATTSCFNCLDADPWALETLTQDTQYQRDQYFSACAQCSKIPSSGDEGAARAQCYECISTKEARLKSDGGFLTYAEYTSANFLPAGRANDFGACVYLANQSYLIAIGSEAVEGVYANCVPEAGVTPQITVGACIACMEFVDQQQANVSSSTPLKSYACADYCQNPDYYPAGSPLSDADLGAACISCLENENVTQAWACGNCMKTPEPTECFSCVAADPYSGNTSNYNWACGMCAQITDDLLRGLCMTCIQSQPGAGVGNTDATTEANICSCIDLIQNNTYDVSRPLTAMERSCFEPFQHYENGELVVPDIPWGNDVVSKVGTNNSECLNCMRIASEFDTQNAPGINKAYACHEYCQNPALVADVQQGRDCALCVISDRVQDPWACETCMSATNDTLKRQDCFTCLRASSKWPSHAWGCGQCAQFSNEAAAGACYQCLSNDDVDPCSCVDGVKNGTIVFGVQGVGLPGDGPDVVCEHSFAALGCPDSAITGQVITEITGLFYGRIKGDLQTCNDPTNQYCGSDSNTFCRGADLTQTCNATAEYLEKVTATAESQCVGRAFCNQLSGGYDARFGPYTLQAENAFFQDPCKNVYKYMKLQYTCGSPVSK